MCYCSCEGRSEKCTEILALEYCIIYTRLYIQEILLLFNSIIILLFFYMIFEEIKNRKLITIKFISRVSIYKKDFYLRI
ncbi:unnamed protein product [Blepharisma stoltei]|uniref:Uncharacterized protein n=1 Tax=Blepharisma stoltei TaxID=1481888 RepID=A0AAU9J174_9CILI|nr:unnamed protein product [Blepharisma stoltei]